MNMHHKETRAAIESIDALHKAMNKDGGYADLACAMIHIVQALMSTDFDKANEYHNAMWIAYQDWREYFDKDHAWYGGPK